MRVNGFLIFLAAVAAFVVVGALMSNTIWLDTLSAIGLALFVANLVHQVGHVLAGLLAGSRPLLVCAWPFKVVFGRHGVHLGKARQTALAMVQPKIARFRVAVLVQSVGGPLAELVLAGLALWGSARYHAGPGTWARYWSLLLRVTGIVAAIDAAFNLEPFFGLLPQGSDGIALRIFARGGPVVARKRDLATLAVADIEGARPRDWPTTPIARALELHDGWVDEASACLHAYLNALDRGDVDSARELLAHSIATTTRYPRTVGKRNFLEAAFFAGRYQRDPVAAASHLEDARTRMGLLVPQRVVLRAEAAVLLVQGKLEEALAKAERALAAPVDPWDNGSIIAEREWLEDILSEARAGLAAKQAEAQEQTS